MPFTGSSTHANRLAEFAMAQGLSWELKSSSVKLAPSLMHNYRVDNSAGRCPSYCSWRVLVLEMKDLHGTYHPEISSNIWYNTPIS